MILWQANLGRGVTRDVFERNLRRVLDAGGPRAVYALQEIDEADAPDEHEIVGTITRNTHHVIGANTAVPILVPRHLDIIGDRQTLACKGLAKYTPHRVVNEALLQLGPNLKVAVLNTHLPIDRPATASRRAEVRRALRIRARQRQQQLMGGVWAADTNTRGSFPVIPGEARVVNAAIDKARAWAPPGRRVVVTEQRTVDLTIDGHDAHGARIRWVRA